MRYTDSLSPSDDEKMWKREEGIFSEVLSSGENLQKIETGMFIGFRRSNTDPALPGSFQLLTISSNIVDSQPHLNVEIVEDCEDWQGFLDILMDYSIRENVNRAAVASDQLLADTADEDRTYKLELVNRARWYRKHLRRIEKKLHMMRIEIERDPEDPDVVWYKEYL